MLGQTLKNATSRTTGLVARQRAFSTTLPARMGFSMEELLLEIPPELRIGVEEKQSSRYLVAVSNQRKVSR
jgi:hypothetical protein